METHKEILYIGCQQDNTKSILVDIENNGWSLRKSQDWQEAAKIVHEHPPSVGVAHIDPGNMPKPTEADELINNNSMQWIALLEPSCLSRADVRNLLNRVFYAYHILPGDAQSLNCLLSHAAAMSQLYYSEYPHHEPIENEYEMVGSTPAMNRLFDMIRKVAMVDAPVLIRGESGTGKELTARAIHERSRRSKGPFNAVNCAALPANLIQSELFGHEKGAFTGASQRKQGRIEATNGGTIFLDEIGDLPMDLQVNLLRFLENQTIQRVGSLHETSVDVRVLAATHVDLEKAVEAGKFREDLYHRLNVLQVNIPPLRARQEDIELLARFFFEKFASEKSSQVKGFSEQALLVMRNHEWPGNVRELINRIRRAMVMCENRLIKPADLGLERRQSSRQVLTLEQARDSAERNTIVNALARNKYKIQRAAVDLGVSRVTLYRLIEKHGIPYHHQNGQGSNHAH